MLLKSDNIEAPDVGSLTWDPQQVAQSLQKIDQYVEKEAKNSIDWYWRNKAWKARFSRYIQLLALILTALAGIFPIIATLSKNMHWPYLSESGLWPSLFVGLAAALLGLDRAFGFSSGWTRYVITATTLRRLLEEFRMDWALLSAKASPSPTTEQVAALIQRAKEFRLAVEGTVLQETKDWAAEFQNNLAQLEKDVKAQLDAVKAKVDKAVQESSAPAATGGIELTVTNADQTDGFSFTATLEGKDGKIAEETITNSKKWVCINVPTGQHRLTARAKANGKDTTEVTVVSVKAGDVAKLEVSLPI